MKRPTGIHKSMGVILAAIVLFACLSGHAASAESSFKILVVKSNNINSYNLAVNGFKQECAGKGVIIEHDLGGIVGDKNMDEMSKILEKEKPDLVAAVGAKAMSAVTQLKVQCPVVFCMIINPPAYDLQKFNVTGVSLTVSPEEQIRVLTSLSPKIKRIGVLLRKQSSSEPLENVIRLAGKYNVEIVPAEFESEKDIPSKLRTILDKVDALWMLDDSYINSKETLEFVILKSLENNLPFMAISKEFVKEGALISLSPSFFLNGRQAAQIARKILAENARPKDIPVSFHKNSELIINLTVARKIGLTIPSTLLDEAGRIYE
jgi:putative ABC transport system substrate-binding protein